MGRDPLMPELFEGLMTTRAMRRFRDEPVADETIEAILRAAVQAPSGGNIQPYRFVVVTDAVKRRAIADIYRRAWERYAPAAAAVTPPRETPEAEAAYARNQRAADSLARNLASVPVLILVLMPDIDMVVSDEEGDMDVGPLAASVYPAVQTLMLAARAHGLGSVLTTVYRIYEDEVRAVCDIPERYLVAALVPLGHPTGKWGVAPRRPAPSITSWNSFGNRG